MNEGAESVIAPPGARVRGGYPRAQAPELAADAEDRTESAAPRFPEWLREYAQHVFNAEKTNRMQREQHWRISYDLLMNRHDWRGKARWQSKIAFSKVPNALNAAMAILKQGLTQISEWFTVETSGDDPIDKELLPFWSKLLRADLEERDPVSRLDFLDTWILGLKGAAATAPLVMKLYPETVDVPVRVLRTVAPPPPAAPSEADAIDAILQDGGAMPPAAPDANPTIARMQAGLPIELTTELRHVRRVRIRKDLVDPFDFYSDAMGRGMHRIQRIAGDLGDLDQMTEEAGYDLAALAEVRRKVTERIGTEEFEKGSRVSEGRSVIARRKTYEGIELWGTVPTEDGNGVERGRVLTVIEEVVVRYAPSPFDGDDPFVYATIEPIPFSTYGRGLVEHNAGVAIAITELANAILDATIYDVLRAFEVDVTKIVNPKEFAEGIRPGSVFQSNGAANDGSPMIRPLDTGSLNTNVFGVYQMLTGQFEEGTTVSELTFGKAPRSGETTAREVQIREGNSNVVFRGIAQWMEKASLEPALEKAFSLLVTYRIFGEGGRQWVEQVLGREEANRFYGLLVTRLSLGDATLELGLEFRVRALTTILAKAQEMDRIEKIIELMQGFPGLANRMDMGKLVRRIMRALALDDDGLVKSEEDLRKIDALEQMVLARLAAANTMQPGSHSGTGIAAGAALAPGGT
jgi:hypothetical protein